MKRQTQVAGVRRWFGDDMLELQSEPLQALDALVSTFNKPFVISGCVRQDDGSVSTGFVALRMAGEEGLKIMPFIGYRHPGRFCIVARKKPVNSVYADGVSRLSAYQYEAWGVPPYPPAAPIEELPPHIEVSTPGTAVRMTDVMQDANHRFVSDYQKGIWDAAKQQAIDSAKLYTDTRETATREFIGQVETGLHNITESLTTTKANKAETVVEVGAINEDPYQTFHESRIVYNDTGGSPSKRGTTVQFCTDRHGIAIQAHSSGSNYFISTLIPTPTGVVGPPPPTMWKTYELFHSGNFDPKEYMKIHTIGKINGTTYIAYKGESCFPEWSGMTCTLNHYAGNTRYMVNITPLGSAKSFSIVTKGNDSCNIQFSAITQFEVQIIKY